MLLCCARSPNNNDYKTIIAITIHSLLKSKRLGETLTRIQGYNSQVYVSCLFIFPPRRLWWRRHSALAKCVFSIVCAFNQNVCICVFTVRCRLVFWIVDEWDPPRKEINSLMTDITFCVDDHRFYIDRK